jgi:pimeloyl-ACP methyl ester carboxylesterase
MSQGTPEDSRLPVERGVIAGLHFQLERGGSGDHGDRGTLARPLVLLPGLLSDGRQLRRVARGLGRPVLTVDPLGVGGSEAPEEVAAYALPELARRLLELLDALGVQGADLVGLSMGGMWAQHALLLDRPAGRERRRERFRAAVLVASAAEISPRLRSVLSILLSFHSAGVSWQDIFRTLQLLFFAPEFLDRPSVIPMLDLLAGEARPRPHVIEGQVAALLGHDPGERLAGLPVRQVLAGEQDLLMPPHVQRQLAARLGEHPPVFIPGGHALWIERPDALSAALSAALAG